MWQFYNLAKNIWQKYEFPQVNYHRISFNNCIVNG
jgi:hypothetical protein